MNGGRFLSFVPSTNEIMDVVKAVPSNGPVESYNLTRIDLIYLSMNPMLSFESDLLINLFHNENNNNIRCFLLYAVQLYNCTCYLCFTVEISVHH